MNEIIEPQKLSIVPNKPYCIWIIEDDPGIQFIYKEILSFKYDIHCFGNLEDFFSQDFDHIRKADLCIVDLRLPDGSFLDHIPQFFKLNIPYLIASSVDDIDILRSCFVNGAKDYLIKPVKKSEMIAKIEKILKELKPKNESRSEAKPFLNLDPVELEVSNMLGISASLTIKEFRIVNILFKSTEKPVSRQELTEQIWHSSEIGEKTLDVHILNTRRKIGHLGLFIHYISPIGFILTDQADPKLAINKV